MFPFAESFAAAAGTAASVEIVADIPAVAVEIAAVAAGIAVVVVGTAAVAGTAVVAAFEADHHNSSASFSSAVFLEALHLHCQSARDRFDTHKCYLSLFDLSS